MFDLMRKSHTPGQLLLITLLALSISACGSSTQQVRPAPAAPEAEKESQHPPQPQSQAKAQAPAPTQANPGACKLTPAMGLPREARATSSRQVDAPGRVSGKKLIFSRAGVQLVFPFTMVSRLHQFLAENGAASFPEERALLAHLEREAPKGQDIIIDPAYPWYKGPRNIMKRRISFLLADLLAYGSFEIRAPRSKDPIYEITVMEYGSYCGEVCGVGGRAILLPGCKIVLYTVDWIS